MKWGLKLVAAAALACTLGAAQASQAAIIDWTLSNGTFDDGGTFSGSFSYDTVTDTITSWHVTTGGGGVPFSVGTTYSSPGGCVLFFCSSAGNNGQGPTFGTSVLFFGSQFALTNLPFTALGSVDHLTGRETSFFFGPGPTRNVTDGQAVGVAGVAGVPEPAEWSLMILGAGLAGAALRSRRRAALA